MTRATNYVRFFQSVTCNQLKSLDLGYYVIRDNVDRLIYEISSFSTLASPRMYCCPVSKCHIGKLALHLPHLTEFKMGCIERVPKLEKWLLSGLQTFPKLKKFSIAVDVGNFECFSSRLNDSMDGFRDQFVKTDLKIKVLAPHGLRILYMKDCLAVRQKQSAEVHRTRDFSDENMRNVMKTMAKNSGLLDFKFINECPESTLDIGTLANTLNSDLRSLEIQSNGPITIDSSVSESVFQFFPS